MKLSELKHLILNNELNSLYVFNGSEFALKRIYLEQMSKVTGLSLYYADTLDSVLTVITEGSIFSDNHIYVIQEDDVYKKSEKLWKDLIELKNDNIIVLLYENVDKRTTFYKTHKDFVIDFDYLSEEILVPRVSALTGFSEAYSKKFVTMCGFKYGRILTEIDKLKALADVENVKLETAFCMALEDKAIYKEVGNVIFDFIDSVLLRHKKKAYYYLNELRQLNESDIKLISLLYTAFRQMLIVIYTPQSKWTSVLGLKTWQCMNIRKKYGAYTPVELVNNVKFIRDVETKVKSGFLDTAQIVDYILVTIM